MSRHVFLAAMLVAAASFIAWAQGKEQANQGTQPGTVAVFDFHRADGDAELRRFGAAVAELLTAELSAEEGLVLVERRRLAEFADELGLALEDPGNSANRLRLGRMVKARKIVGGSLLGSERSLVAVVRITDSETGVLQDVLTVDVQPDRAGAAAKAIADAVAAPLRIANSAKRKPRVFLGVGGFEDLCLTQRHANLGAEIRAFAAQRYTGRHRVVERSLVTPLLRELELYRGGLTEQAGDRAHVQVVGLLVDGLYQLRGGDEAGISMVLRLQAPGGTPTLRTVASKPGEELNARIAEAIDRALKGLETGDAAINADEAARKEAKIHFQKGMERSRLVYKDTASGYPRVGGRLGGYLKSRDPEKRKQNLEEAVQAFEASLLLDPRNYETRLMLGICLCDEDIARVERGQNLLREVIAGSDDTTLQAIARYRLAKTTEDPVLRLKLLNAHLRRQDDPDYQQYILWAIERAHRDAERQGTPVPRRSDGRVGKHRVSAEFSDYLRNHPAELTHVAQRIFNACEVGFSSGFDITARFYVRAERVLKDTDRTCDFMNRIGAEMKRVRPGIYPYFELYRSKCGRSSIKPLDPEQVKTMLGAVQRIAMHPNRVEDPQRYARFAFGLLRTPLMQDQDAESLLEVAQLVADTHSEKMPRNLRVKEFKARVYAALAWCHWHLDDPEKAAAALRQVPFRSERILWDASRKDSHRTVQAALDECREALGETVERNKPDSFTLPKHCLETRSATHLSCTNGTPWVATANDIRRFDGNAWKTVIERPKLPVKGAITAFEATRNRLYAGGFRSGLYVLRHDGTLVRHYTEEDGLPISGVSVLHKERDRLWVGFAEFDGKTTDHGRFVWLRLGRQYSGGAVGYLDLSRNRIVSLLPSVATRNGEAPHYGKRHFDRADAPPRHAVVAVTPTGDHDLWVAVRAKGVQHCNLDTQTWRTASHRHNFARDPKPVLQDKNSKLACLVANARYVAAGCAHWGVGAQVGGLVILDRETEEWTQIHLAAGLPAGQVYSLAITDRQQLWVGGNQYLAVIDLASKTVRRICAMPYEHALELEIDGDGLWVVTAESQSPSRVASLLSYRPYGELCHTHRFRVYHLPNAAGQKTQPQETSTP